MTTKAIKKVKTAAEAHAVRQAEARAKADQGRQEMGAALADLDRLRPELQDVQDALDDGTEGWKTGDESYTDADLTTDQAKHRRLSALVSAAEGRYRAGKAKTKDTDQSVADLLAPVIADAFQGLVPVIATSVRPLHDESTDVAVYVWQGADAVNAGGLMSAKPVHIYFRRNPLYARLDADPIVKAIEGAGFRARPMTPHAPVQGRRHDGYNWDDLRLDVGLVAPELPVIAKNPSESEAKGFAQTWLATAKDCAGRYRRNLAGKLDDVHLSHRTEGGQRRTTVRFTVSGVRSQSNSSGSVSAFEYLAGGGGPSKPVGEGTIVGEACDTLTRHVASGLGRATKVTFTFGNITPSATGEGGSLAAPVTVTAEFIAAVS